jgi:hypothetical protein
VPVTPRRRDGFFLIEGKLNLHVFLDSELGATGAWMGTAVLMPAGAYSIQAARHAHKKIMQARRDLHSMSCLSISRITYAFVEYLHYEVVLQQPFASGHAAREARCSLQHATVPRFAWALTPVHAFACNMAFVA